MDIKSSFAQLLVQASYLGRDVDVARRLSLAAVADGVVLRGAVLLHVPLGALEDLLLLGGGRLFPSFKRGVKPGDGDLQC